MGLGLDAPASKTQYVRFTTEGNVCVLVRALVVAVLALASGPAYAGPTDDATAVLGRWAAAFSANDADAVVRLYAPTQYC
jgi:hypothetical protein